MVGRRARYPGGVRGLAALGMVALVLVSGCQGWGGKRLESWPEARDDGGGGTTGGAELGRFMAFVRERQAALRGPRVPEAERRAGEAALLELMAWLHGRSEEQLAREEPDEVYLRFKVARVQQGREDAVRDAAVERKLEEYWQWARARSRLLAGRHFRKAGREWLVTENPVYEEAQDALTSAVLGWAYAHTQDPDYLRKSPQEVAVYLLARRGALATALALGNAAPPHLDFVPEPVETVAAAEVLLEVAVGLVPLVGEGPLAEVARAVKAGAHVPLVGSRATAEGARLVPGSPEHLAQAWVDYQFRHPGKHPRFSYAPDSRWERMYRTVLENKGHGGAFEQEVLKAHGYEKNSAMMLPPPGSADQGFVPDSVVGNPEELVWGRPYRFVEVKGRAEMSLTGNLKAMLTYVETYGGHLEVWFRSAQHQQGQTKLSKALGERFQVLVDEGQAQVKSHP